jgi:hypothetical protein
MIPDEGRPDLVACPAAWAIAQVLRHVPTDLRGETCNPSFSRNSLAILSSPHVGLSRAILRIRFRNSRGKAGRPDRDLSFQ